MHRLHSCLARSGACFIAISFGYVLVQYLKRRLPFGLLLPFILNLVFNAAYTPIQFGLKNNLLASADILLVLVHQHESLET